MSRIIKDFQYIFLNNFVNNIPSWKIRKIFYQFFGMDIKKGSRIAIKTIVINPKGITLGDRSIINECCFIDGRGGLVIGTDVSISVGSKIVTASHKSYSSTFEYKSSKTIIENNVWLGIGAIILDNSHLCEGVIISAGSVFKGDSEKLGVYSGNFAKKIGVRKLEEFYEIDYHPYFR